MTIGWGLRQVGILLLLAAILVLISGVLELSHVVRVASDGAAVESGLIAHTLLLQIGYLAQQSPQSPFEALQSDPRAQLVLQAAVVQSPSVVFVAVVDTTGTSVAHTNAEMVGRRLDPLPPLPRPRSLTDGLGVLARLRESPPVYGAETPLVLGGRPFATIVVGVAGGLLRERVDEVFQRGLRFAVPQLLLAVLVGFGMAAVLRVRLRTIEAGVAALREGRYGSRIPESGVDEFSRLARDLNLLSEQFDRERRGQEARLRETVEHLGDGILVLDASGRVVLANRLAESVLGAGEEWIGRSVEQALPESHPVRRMVEELRRGDARPLTVPLPGTGRNGDHVAVGHPILGQDGMGGGVLVEIKKTEALRELHSLVDQSRVLSRLGKMAAGVAHEIRNPLQTINLELGILRNAGDLSAEEISEHVRTANEEVQRLQRAVSGFLKVARLQRMSLGTVRLDEIVAEVHRALEPKANMAGLDLDLRMSESVPPVVGDAGVLRQAIENLVGNAVEAQPSREGRVVLEVSEQEREVRVAISDTGPGIPEENLERIFDLYFSTKDGGTGVGLAMVRQAVEMHSGLVEVRSTPTQGTTMILRIPAQAVHEEV